MAAERGIAHLVDAGMQRRRQPNETAYFGEHASLKGNIRDTPR